jgi:ADP-heptose:LPS heptosyltransferase/predicted SAM-dependent methyltransferase
MVWERNKPQSHEYKKIKYEIVPYTRGRVLDLGCGPYITFPHFIGVDNTEEFNKGARWRPDITADARDLSIFATNSIDAVFSSHLLEHFENTEKVLKEWWRVIKPGGYLVLYLPHKKYYPNIGEEGANEEHKHDFMPNDIIEIMKRVDRKWDLVEDQERNQNDEYSFFQVYQKVKRNGSKHRYPCWTPKPDKTCAVVRYGGVGDMLQSSSIFPLLKDQGYHLTLYTSVTGYEISKNDPHVDKFIVQDTDQVPNHELGNFFRVLRKKYDKFINLCESVEGTFLAMEDRIAYQWPYQVRHEMLNKNYVEFTHALAEVPFKPYIKFYSTSLERQWAKKQRKKLGGRVILWIMTGSSVHKVWPYVDQVIARVMLTYPDCKIVLVGDEVSQLAERGWENEPRVIKACGKWSIRNTLAFAQYADLVIGPETGVLNSVSMEPIPKIICLSHSSIENLTRDWTNAISLVPEDCPCWPCHQIQHGFDPCIRDKEVGVALCQARISAEQMWGAINVWFNKEKREIAL